MNPLSKALLFGGVLVRVVLSGVSMTGLNLGGLLVTKGHEPELVSRSMVTPSLDPTAEPAGSIVLPAGTPSVSAEPLSPYSSNADPVPARGYAPEHVAPGTRFVVGAELGTEST